jgi:SAM-dependent methyltransferase
MRATRASFRSSARRCSGSFGRVRASGSSTSAAATGALAASLIAAGCEVIGIDAAPDMVEAARAKGIDARLMDGKALAFEAEFDAVFSNAALHWMRDPDSVIRGVRRALVRGGRFVGEFGGHGNVASITVALVAVLDGAASTVRLRSPGTSRRPRPTRPGSRRPASRSRPSA